MIDIIKLIFYVWNIGIRFGVPFRRNDTMLFNVKDSEEDAKSNRYFKHKM
jgi:hypothetical protein